MASMKGLNELLSGVLMKFRRGFLQDQCSVYSVQCFLRSWRVAGVSISKDALARRSTRSESVNKHARTSATTLIV